MNEEFTLKSNNKKIVEIIKLLLIIGLLVLEVIICAQYASYYIANGGIAKLVSVIVCCVSLAVFVTIDFYAVSNFAADMVFFGINSALLLALCILTGNSYLSALYCIVLTQFYISVDSLKLNGILFGVSCGLYTVSFITGGIVGMEEGASAYQTTVRIVGDCIVGVSILALHFVITNFILTFYSKNKQLRFALNEADESKARLKEVYERLSRTAVYEERNRIAKDIHDNAGHSMTTVIMQIEAAKLLIDENPAEAKNRIISANIQAKNALEQMRESVHLLAGRQRASSLKESIEEVIAQTIDGTELKVRCDIEDVPVGEEMCRFVLNTVKESLANGIRHGKATAFYIEMKKSFSDLDLLISDNGRGIDGQIIEGFGLKGIREKAETLGGRCRFSGEAGEGFEIELSLPLDKKDKGGAV